MQLNYGNIARAFAATAAGAVMLAGATSPSFANDADKVRALQHQHQVLQGEIKAIDRDIAVTAKDSAATERDTAETVKRTGVLNAQAAEADSQAKCGKELIAMAAASISLKTELHGMKANGLLTPNNMCTVLQRLRERASLPAPARG